MKQFKMVDSGPWLADSGGGYDPPRKRNDGMKLSSYAADYPHMHKPRRTLNIDCGEGLPYPDDLFECATLLNVGAGSHAGSWTETVRFVDECELHGVMWGAHPGYPDREGFGRRPWEEVAQPSWADELVKQAVLMANLGARYIKPHGAFYNETARGISGPTEALLESLRKSDLPLLGLPGSYHERLAEEAEVGFWSEGFADRGYGPDGHLLPRDAPGALIEDPQEAAEAARRLVEQVDSICLHSDLPGWEDRMRAVRAALDRCP